MWDRLPVEHLAQVREVEAGNSDGSGTGSATYDATGAYRFRLDRTWDASAGTCAFVMLNPSTATASRLDPTVRRCFGFARRWGYGSMVVVNAFALRSTDPRALLEAADPVGPGNDEAIRAAAEGSDLVVAAWGVRAALGGRDAVVAEILDRATTGRVRCLGRTRDGHPRHPLYLRADLEPIAWAGTSPASGGQTG